MIPGAMAAFILRTPPDTRKPPRWGRFVLGATMISLWLLCLCQSPILGTALSAQLSSSSSRSWLAQTKETFKLADVYHMTAQMEASAHRQQSLAKPSNRSNVLWNYRRLLVDAGTGSSLLQYQSKEETEDSHTTTDSSEAPHLTWPTFFQHCDWVGTILAEASTVEALVEQIRRCSSCARALTRPWTVRYQSLTSAASSSSQRQQRRSHTERTLLCAISHALGTVAPPPALHPARPDNLTQDHLLLVQAILPPDVVDGSIIHKQHHRFYLVQTIPSVGSSTAPTLLRDKWAQRPYIFCSAINPNLADLILDVLEARLLRSARQQRQHTTLDSKRLVRFWDPTCGSGTLVVAALERGMHATGWDVNPQCVEGTRENVMFAFPNQTNESNDASGTSDRCDVRVQDSSVHCSEHLTNMLEGYTDQETLFDCVACNLPWGLNTKLEFGSDENRRILRAVRVRLGRPGVPCVFVTKQQNDYLDDNVWQILGYQRIDSAHVPQQNFVTPQSKKRPKQRKAKQKDSIDKGRSHCVVTVVETI